MGIAKHVDRVDLTGSRPRAAAARRLSTWTMTREALTVGLDDGDGFLGRTRGADIARFRCAGRRFVSISHPEYVDHVLHEGAAEKRMRHLLCATGANRVVLTGGVALNALGNMRLLEHFDEAWFRAI